MINLNHPVNPPLANVPFLYPLKTSEKQRATLEKQRASLGFLTFLEGMEREHWPEMGQLYSGNQHIGISEKIVCEEDSFLKVVTSVNLKLFCIYLARLLKTSKTFHKYV